MTPTGTVTGTWKRVYLPVVLKKPHCCDVYEPNDACPQAHGPLHYGIEYEACLCTELTSDWYFIDLDAAGRITIDLDVPEALDYQLYLYDRCGAEKQTAS